MQELSRLEHMSKEQREAYILLCRTFSVVLWRCCGNFFLR